MTSNYQHDAFSREELEARNRWKRRKDLLFKWALSLFLLVLALIPTWAFLLVYHFTRPQGFFEKFAVMGFGIWFGGAFQLFLLLTWVYAVIQVADM